MPLILPRRSFLIGAASLLAAPAIVRAQSLMPVKVQLGLRLPPPVRIINPLAIADAFAKKLYECGKRPTLLPVGTGRKQLHVDLPSAGAGVSSDLITAAAVAMAPKVGNVAAGLLLPVGVYAAALGQYKGVQVRYISDYSIASDTIIHRFDLISD